MKLKRFAIIVLAVVAALSLFSCGENANSKYEGKAKVVFELEGGTYKNSGEALTHYYSVENGQARIIAPETIDDRLFPIQKSGYVIDGWYRTKTVNGDEVTYEDEWDFAGDRVGAEGVTLYAKWVKDVSFTYTVCYRNEKGEIVPVSDGSVYRDIVEGEAFEDYDSFAEKREGYTFLGEYETESGEPWDENFGHPGDRENPNVNVIAVYFEIKGDFVFVDSAKAFIDAAEKGTKDIYLTADVDLGGRKIRFASFAGKQILGNGHTVSNFELDCEIKRDYLVSSPDDGSANSACISLLGGLDGSTVKDIFFLDVKIVIADNFPSLVKSFYFAPLAVTVKDSTVQNVQISAKVSYSEDAFAGLEAYAMVTDGAFYKESGENDISGVTVELERVTEQTDNQ